jgi:hypothetical protein
MSEHIEMVCEGCDQRFVHEQPEVSIAGFLHEAVALGWRDIAEQENIPQAIEVVQRLAGVQIIAMFDALCPACVARVRELGRERIHLKRALVSFRR